MPRRAPKDPNHLAMHLPMTALGCVLLVASAPGCAGRFELDHPPESGFDVAVVLGCPNLADGKMSRCQVSRAVWAAELWRRGVVRHFITSGGAVHTPWVEAETLASAMVALGVPAERIYLETEALHTDENAYNGMRLAGALGLRTMAVVSNKGHAAWACKMMNDWGRECAALNVDTAVLEARKADFTPRLDALQFPRVPATSWLTLEQRERLRANDSGRRRRPPSYLLYPYLGLARLFGSPWIPSVTRLPAPQTWAERRVELAAATASLP